MRLSILTAGIILIAISTAPSMGYAAGQPQVETKDSSAAATGKTGDQAEKSKMEMKKERDAGKYQSPAPAKTEK
jgi:hypothetical protein